MVVFINSLNNSTIGLSFHYLVPCLQMVEKMVRPSKYKLNLTTIPTSLHSQFWVMTFT